MGGILSFFTFRTIILLFSTTFSVLIVMLMLNIITVEEVIVMLDLSEEAANALRLIISRFQEVTGNILDILSQLLTKLMSFAGVEVDLSKIKIDINQETLPPKPITGGDSVGE